MFEHKGKLPRLGRSFYQGEAVVFWTLTMEERATGWLNEGFHARFRELMVHAAFRERVICPVYVLMPDHLHLVWMGLGADSDQLRAMAFLRRELGKLLSPSKLQKQAFDRVLREEERRKGAFESAVSYVLENPVRKGLVKEAREWSYVGCVVPGYPEIGIWDADYWVRFWRVYVALKGRERGDWGACEGEAVG